MCKLTATTTTARTAVTTTTAPSTPDNNNHDNITTTNIYNIGIILCLFLSFANTVGEATWLPGSKFSYKKYENGDLGYEVVGMLDILKGPRDPSTMGNEDFKKNISAADQISFRKVGGDGNNVGSSGGDGGSAVGGDGNNVGSGDGGSGIGGDGNNQSTKCCSFSVQMQISYMKTLKKRTRFTLCP
jgi:hypothetical protein